MPLSRSSARPGRVLATLLTAVVVLGGCDRIGIHSDGDYLERARAFEAKGDYTSAILEVKNALQKNPQNAEARLLLADALIHVGSGAEAEIALKQAADNGADEQAVALAIGRAILLQGDFKRVLADVAVLPTSTPAQAARILAIRGDAFLEMGRFDDATKTFAQALTNEPELTEALVGQARIALAGRHYDEAQALLKRVLDRSPSDLSAMIVRGDIAKARGDFAQAAAQYQKVLELDANNLIALVDLASLEMAAGRFDEAAKHIATIRRFPGAEVMSLYLQAFLDFRKQNFAAVREPIQKVLAVAPNHLPSIVLAGVNEFALNSNEQAEKFLRQALSVSPNIIIAKRVLIATLLRTGQIPQALDLVKVAVIQTPDDAALMTLAGETYMRAGDFASASKYLAKATALDPKNSAARTQLGISRLAAGDNAAALSDLEAAVQTDQQDYKPDMLMVVAYMNQKDFPNAAKAIDALEQKQPKNPIPYNFRGGLLLATKDVPGARAAFQKALDLDPTYVPAAINLARLDVADKKPDVAMKRFTTILDKDPTRTDASLALVELQRAAKAPPAEIVATLDRAIKADPKAVKPLVLMAQQQMALDPTRALDAAKKAAALSPNSPEVLDALGAAQLATGEERGALTTYTKLVDVSPRSAVAMFRLASLLNNNANPAAATRLLQKALEIQPDYLEAQAALVSLQLSAGSIGDALKLARRVETSKPQSPFGFLLEGDALMASKAYAKAAAAYEKAYALNRSGGLAIKVHAAYSAAGQGAAGEARLQDWLKQAPDDTSVRYYLASAAATRRDYRTAIEQYETILRKEPDNAVVLNDLAAAYDQAKDPRALQTAEAAHKSRPDEAPINDTLGWMLVQRGEVPRGLQLLRDAARTAPQVIEIRMHLVQALLKTGDKDAARTELEAIVNRRENFPQRMEAEKLLASMQVDG